MNKPSSSSVAGTQPIPGYTLRKRLGAGGYGEVWLADAPGGLQKAIKLIFGNVDESRASSELRSLERIRKANHPFLLSIERIEILSGRLIIVTELAESSLQDRFESCRRKGLPGIPRADLLDYLRDTSDALDFLAQKHSLQHLDIKPGNLLIVADRVKVADFGLVKDLHDSNQSLVGGLTPTYSAPEVFDGRPNFRSDQYSLAIVYMEMLTGRLPFRGTSAGELARQHLNQAPELDPLPPADRNIVRRALSKSPQDRYANCRQFIDQLLKVRGSVLPSLESTDKPAVANSDKSTQQPTAATRCWTDEIRQTFQAAIPHEQILDNWTHSRSMFIGVGGQGILALKELRRDLIQNVDDRFSCDDHEWLAVDTSQEELAEVTSGSELERIPWESAVALPIQSPHSYRKLDPAVFAPLSRRWLYNIPRSMKTEGVRPIATLTLVAHYSALQNVIEKKLAKLIQNQAADSEDQSPIRIYLLASLHGGTGAALLAELGMMVRSAMANLNYTKFVVSATASVATTSNSQISANLPAANAIVSLSELCHWMNPARERPQIDYRTGYATSCVCPFEWVTLVDGGLFEDRAAKAQNPRNLARVVALDCQTLSASALAESRREARHASPLGWLRTATAATVQDYPDLSPEVIAQWCCLQSLKSTRLYLSGSQTAVESSSDEQLRGSPSSVSQMPLTDDACAEFTCRLLRELGFGKTTDEVFHGKDAVSQWNRRISDDPATRGSQILLDIRILQSAISRVVEMRAYNWTQVCRIQLKAIEALQIFSDQHVPDCAQHFDRYLDLLGMPNNLVQRIRTYLTELGEAVVKVMEASIEESKKIMKNLDHWWNSLQNDPLAFELSKVNRSALPPQVQHLCDRVKAQLDGKFNNRLVALFSEFEFGLQASTPSENGTLKGPKDEVTSSYSQMLLWSGDLVNQLCSEMTLEPSDLRGGVYHHSVISTRDAEKLVPPLASGGGELFRLMVASEEQFQNVVSSLEKAGLKGTTTILPGTQSMGVHLLCDATHINLTHIVTTLWRPSSATLSLAERLRTRVDIDWDAISRLLDSHQTMATPTGKDSAGERSDSTASVNAAPIIPGTPLPAGSAIIAK